MNIRKSIDYSATYAALDKLMVEDLPQMELYREIGKLISGRPEKGAAAAASEYLQKAYPDISGFSPRNLRRMRDFYRLYSNNVDLLNLAMQIGWTQNIVILEADLTMEERTWYLLTAAQFSWSKSELISQINASAHLTLELDEQVDPDKPERAKYKNRRINFIKPSIPHESWMLSGFRRRAFRNRLSTCPVLKYLIIPADGRKVYEDFNHGL